ncbi:MAG: sigma-70 family RNA polymerase sigma factor [Sphingomonadales bacterium]|nr:sigma-70 family RNA polymerase sigma factor [Sphingomonadales bacterium]
MTDRRPEAGKPGDFKHELVGALPHLRAFARGLCGRPDMADDLVQETMVKAWAARERFQPGTSIKAWTFVILRNVYLTQMRRNRFTGEYDEQQAERVLVSQPGQEAPIHLADMHAALLRLPPERREALLLVGAGGFSYEEAAAIAGCAVGTMKSRVARARATLAGLLEQHGNAGKAADRAPDGRAPQGDAARAIMADLAAVSRGHR